MSFFAQKNKFSYTLIVSLKSSSINLQVLKEGSTGTKEVEFVLQHTILLQDSQDPLLYMNQYSKELTQLFDTHQIKIKQIVRKTPLQIYFLLYAPWFTSKIDTILYKEEMTLTQDFIDKEIKKVDAQNNLKVLERQIIKLKTNGYTITEIKNIKCSNVEVSTYTSYMSLKTHDLIYDITQKYFSTVKDIKFCTSPLMTLDNIKRFMVKEDNIIFLNIGAEITELGIIEDDALCNFSTFPIGVHDFLRVLQTNVKSYDYDLLYQKEILIKSPSVQAQFDALKQEWLNSFLQTLTFLKEQTPHKIVLISDSKVKDFFSLILSGSIMSNTQTNLKKYRIINFDISSLKDIITYKTPIGENGLHLKLEALI